MPCNGADLLWEHLYWALPRSKPALPYRVFMTLIIHSRLAVQIIYVHQIGNVAERRVVIVLQTQALVARMIIPLQNYDGNYF